MSGNATTWAYALSSVYRGCFDRWASILGTIEGARGYTVDTMPRGVPSDGADYFIWGFDISGGPIEVFRQTRAQVVGGAWHMDARLEVVCGTDDLAKRIAGEAMEALPFVEADVTGLARLYPVSFPEFSWELREVVDAERAGEEARYRIMVLPMRCAFGNTEKLT